MPADLVRVLIVDDHEIVREGLASLLRGARRVHVVGQVGTGQEAVDEARRSRPDVVLLDIRMRDMDGLQAAPLIHRAAPGAAIIFLTMFDEVAFLRRAVDAGAAGYLLKGVERDALVRAIVAVHEGETIFDPALMPMLLDGRRGGSSDPPGSRLTGRELEVLTEIVAGRTNLEIAAELSISLETVKTHVQRVIAKLDASDRTQAAVLAITRGIVSPPRAR